MGLCIYHHPGNSSLHYCGNPSFLFSHLLTPLPLLLLSYLKQKKNVQDKMGFKVHVFYNFILEEYIMHVDSENKEVKSNFSAETIGRFEPARF